VKGMKWREIEQLPDFYGIPLGTLERIASGRDPKDPTVRRQLGLPDLSPTCNQCFRVKETAINRVKRSRPKRIQDYPLEMLRVALEHREEI
jgi:hypothetical protein